MDAEQGRDLYRAILEEHRIAYTAVTGERDAAEARATRLESLEQAARAVCTAESGAVWVAIADLAVALDALAAPPGETRSANDLT